MDLVWYVAYGSNLHLSRFRCYLAGGVPAGGARRYPGCRDTTEPAEIVSVEIPGGLYFAGRSRVWGGGLAYVDTNHEGTVAARAYLLTPGQLSDVVLQEKWQEPGTDLDFASVLPGSDLDLGSSGYELARHVGVRADRPMLTITRHNGMQELSAPSAAYLRTIGAGLGEAHGWSSDRIGEYLSAAPGARGAWTADQIAAVADEALI